MKRHLKYFWGCLLLTVLAACTADTPLTSADNPEEASTICISTAPMMTMGEWQTRALSPVDPSVENYIHSLAVLVFDQELTHAIRNSSYYKYFTFSNPGVTVTLDKTEMPARSSSYIYIIANLPEETLVSKLRNISGGGNQITRSAFLNNMVVEIPYIMKMDSVGLVSTTYMSGQYEGKLDEGTVNITMGRIITRLNVTLSLTEELEKLGYGYAIRLIRVRRTAYVIPGDSAPSDGTVDDNYLHPVDLSSTPMTFYYYVGPHSADSEGEATSIEITYGKKGNDGKFDANASGNKKVTVPLCNTLDGTIPRAYWLNRNSSYNISILLKTKESPNTRSSTSTGEKEIIIEL